MDQYTKTLLTIITVCVVIVTLIIVGSVIIHDHDDEHDGDYHEYMEHIIERLESIEERLDYPMRQILLTTLLIFGATVVSAEIKAGEILGTGKVINQFDQPSKRNGKLILIHKVYVDYQSNLYECIINKTEGNIKCVVND